MTAQTIGQDVLDRVSEAEATCLRSSIGDEAYEKFLGGQMPLAVASPVAAVKEQGSVAAGHVVRHGDPLAAGQL